MSDAGRGLLQALAEGTRERYRSGRATGLTWARRVAPAAVVLRVTVALAVFTAAELAVPAEWAGTGFYLALAALAALLAALRPGGVAPLAAIVFVLAAWLLTDALDGGGASESASGADDDPALWTAAALACLLYTAHSAAAVSQRLRTTTAVDGEIILTWAKHLGLVLASTVGTALALALITAYFTGLTAGLAIGAGIVAAVTVIYVLARSLHNHP